MKKILIFTAAGLVLFLAGCINQNTNQPVTNKSVPTENSKQSVPTENPKQVVENYVKYTLSIPANYDLAKQYLTPDLQSTFVNNPGFVPQSYGIQDNPISTTINTASIADKEATVRTIGQYSTSQISWDFTVVIINNEWKISKIDKVSE